MQRRRFCGLLATAGAAAAALPPRSLARLASGQGSQAEHARFVLDMVGQNPGEGPPKTIYSDPKVLTAIGDNGQVILSLVEGVPTFDSLPGNIIPARSPERAWAEQTAREIDTNLEAAHASGLQCFAWMQLVVLPVLLVQAYKNEICDEMGRVDAARPRTQELLALQLDEIMKRFPKLDGLVIRTGEVYLHDFPYHASTSAVRQTKVQGSSAILHADESHTTLLRILRDRVCVKGNRIVFYRTWDFGHFHTNPTYYLRVTDAIEPHPKLLFSIKHQAGDFHRLTPFNPTLTIGKHRQIVEVECQLEAYGKGAHPYYIGDGVINGWEETAHNLKAGQAHGLRDIVSSPLFAGTWTWSRGGGWEGPYITNEFWCALNIYVVTKFGQEPKRTEPEIFTAYAKSIGLRGKDVGLFREMQLLTAKAVLRGQLTGLGASIDVWWTRDDKLGNPNLESFEQKHLAQAAMLEKDEARRMWDQIAALGQQIRWKDGVTREFVIDSVDYGRYKYAVIRTGWMILFLGREGDHSGHYETGKLKQAIAEYDAAWAGWRKLKSARADCSSIYKDVGFNNSSGLGAAVNKYRALTA